ncbi:MAG: hypothetical protein KC636_13785 [Myxococcales bacterium]|nr:hypothetical protein [Myxococcales bacterium]
MHVPTKWTTILGLSLLLPACGDDKGSSSSGSDTDASSTTEGGSETGGSTEGSSGSESEGTGGSDSDSDSDTGEPAVPHALGTISLIESHTAEGGSSTPSVSAFFVPNTEGGAGGQGCFESVSGCKISMVPDCEGSCAGDEYCTFDDACASKCARVCDASCAPDEVCYFPAPDSPACKKVEAFDAGALTFLGTPIAINLFPPYSFAGDSGSPFSPGGMASVQASGATAAGFTAFEKSFTGTTFVQTTPSLETLGLADVFGDGPLPIRWAPGADKVTITVTVTSTEFAIGTLTCEVDDAAGAFDVPRQAILAAIDNGAVSSLSVSVARRRVETHKDLATTGTLTGVNVEPVGWLDIVTSSVESHSFAGCGGGEVFCGDACIDVLYDNDNCGQCGNKCMAGTYCDFGQCACDGGIVCGNSCVDIYSDTNNCGDCGNKCPSGAYCDFGDCACEFPEELCGNSCVDTQSDEDNCGFCNNKCGANETCQNGFCQGGNPDVGTCCTPMETIGCSNGTIQNCVCTQDDYCCATKWDQQCVNEVEEFGCGSCN